MPTDRQLAQHWFRAAAELGHGHAQMMLGRYLSSGAAGDQDDDARVWLERAVAQGIAEAEPDLAALRAPARASLPVIEHFAVLRNYDTGRGAYYAIQLTRGINECWRSGQNCH